MIFYIKLKKLKNLNKRFSSSFTLLELVIVIILIGILAAVLPILVPNNNLQIAADNLIKNIYFTQSLALKDDKYQPFPLDNSKKEGNRSKYWFKQWWQIRFSTFKDSSNKTHYWYEIFSDVPSNSKSKNFDAQANLPTTDWEISIAKNPLNNKLMIGHCGASQYPPCDKTDTKLDLTKTYGIKYVKFINFYYRSPRLVFDNYGNIFLKEGKDGDSGDINPLDTQNRMLLTKIAKIRLCLDENCKDLSKNKCIQLNITPTGFIYKSECN